MVVLLAIHDGLYARDVRYQEHTGCMLLSLAVLLDDVVYFITIVRAEAVIQVAQSQPRLWSRESAHLYHTETLAVFRNICVCWVLIFGPGFLFIIARVAVALLYGPNQLTR